MRTIFRWLFRLAATVLLLAVALVLGRNFILKQVIEWQIQSRTGMDVRIGYVNLGLLTAALRIEDAKVYYPADLGGVKLLEIPELYMEYDRGALWWRHLRIPRARLKVNEVNIIEGRFGLPPPRKPARPPAPPAAGNPIPWLAFDGIERLELSLGRVKFSSPRTGGQAREVVVDLQDLTLRNLKSPSDFTWQLLPVLLAKGLLSGPN